jgi:hypothetical protein
MKRDGPNVPNAIHGPSGPKYHLLEKDNKTADCLENPFTSHDMCEDNQERRVKARVQALLPAVENTLLKESGHVV